MNIRRKIALYGLGSAYIFVSGFSATQATFLEEMQTMGIDTTVLQGEKGVSRYEVTRLLNASECKDCLHPTQSTIDTYTSIFRNAFAATPGKDFSDISYLQALAGEKNYYYCVAYVGEQNYMRGYPKSTSPVCAGKFCGQQLTTKAEFIQIIVNLLSQYLYEGTQMRRKDADARLKKLKETSYESKSFTTEDKKIITQENGKCKQDAGYLSTPTQMQIYLKYCMFNLKACGMQTFEGLKQGYWPVAEVNMLYKQNIITLNQDLWKQSYEIIDGQTVLAILSNVYNKIQCSFNNDYDCDTIANNQDNCPNDYNPSQKDTDKDGIGDVCSLDGDGDKIPNPKNIIDDNGRVNIGALKGWTGQLDNCLSIPNPEQKDANHNGIGDECEQDTTPLGLSISIPKIDGIAPLQIPFEAIGEGLDQTIQRDFGDGEQTKGKTVQHTFLLPGTYRVQASTIIKNKKIKAQVMVIVGGQRDKQVALQVKSSSIGKTETGEFTVSTSLIGQADSITRSFSPNDTTNKTPEEIIRKILPPGQYTVTVKANKTKELQAVSMFTIGVGNNKGSILKSNFLNPEINQKTEFQTQTFGFSQNDIAYVQWDFGDGTRQNNQYLSLAHRYTQGGKRAVTQTIYFTDGTQLTNIITLYIVDKTLLRSYAITITPSLFSAKRGESIKFTTKLVGDKISSVLSFIQRFTSNKTETTNTAIEFPNIQQYTYTDTDFYFPESNLFINQCTYLKAQATIHIQGEDSCLEAKKDGTLLKKFRCDKDKDAIPDICDDDIDGDGIKNAIGLITHEQAGCSIDQNNIDTKLMQDQVSGVCSLDNAPFDANPNQEDLNGDGKGDANTIAFVSQEQTKQDNDSDGDGINDTADRCPYIHGMGSPNGCPNITQRCGENESTTTETTNTIQAILGSFIINNGATYTKDTLVSIDAITTIGNYYPLQIRFSNDKKNRDARLPVTENKQWKLMDGDGVKTVYMQIQDAQGNTNIEDISDTIILYTTPGIIQETQSGIYVTTPSGSIITGIVLPEIIPGGVTTSGISTTVPGTSLPGTITPEITITSIECNQCPCQYTDFVQNLTNGDEVKAILRNKEKTTLYNYSLPRIVNF